MREGGVVCGLSRGLLGASQGGRGLEFGEVLLLRLGEGREVKEGQCEGLSKGLSGPREGGRGSAFVQVLFLSLGEGCKVKEGGAV